MTRIMSCEDVLSLLSSYLDSEVDTITEADIHQFAQFSGDWNAVHVDETVAAPMFGNRIAHGPMFPGIAMGMLAQFDLIEDTAIALKDLSWEFLALSK